MPYSNALQARLRARGAYLVGPIARYNLNFDRLSPLAQETARAAGLGPVCRNPFRSIIVRSIEMVYACDEALRLIESYVQPESAAVTVAPRAGVGYACTEAPRGVLYHRYEISDRGRILDARIVPPTSQNQATIEADLRGYLTRDLDRPKAELTRACERVIRNHDPCISCATHLVRLEFDP